ncbi:hypothetical protein GLYMA_10G006900v4 [Glycine max]|uniref:Uncharacterized protein n=1 Tax=Glycine max TaxID=3847 RepID=A0A0R0HML1_SOYBN|nr:hypothetical protein GYH30_026554 [Glycine max]KRH31708.1 hypothetical protein GLYMA_10G006900v4 [Glycine max]
MVVRSSFTRLINFPKEDASCGEAYSDHPCFLLSKVHFVWLEASVFLVGGGDGDHDHLPPKENDDQQGK